MFHEIIIIKKKIMNKKLIFILVLALALTNAADLSFSLTNTRYTKASDFWTVEVPCSGGSGNYQYSCDLPTGWSIQNNLFKIPSSCATNYNFEYVSRCRIIDINLGQILERALCFKVTTGGYVITDQDYFYGQTSYSSGSIGTISGADILKRLSTLTGSISTTSFGSLGAIGGSYTGGVIGGITGGVSGVFSGLPTWSDCDNLIKNGNIVEILSLIQKIVSSTTLKCSAKVAYLNDLLGRINAGLKIKKESIVQLQALIDGITVQIQKLLVQIQNLKNEQSSLDLAGLKAQIDALMIKVKEAYNQYNTCVSSTKDYNLELESLKKEQQELEAKVYQLKCQIDELIAKINQLDIDIAALEKKLTELKAQRSQFSSQLTTITAEWNAKKERLEWVKTRIQWLINKINEINAGCASIKQSYEKLEYDLKVLQEKYNQACARSDQINQQITSIQVEIDRLKAREVTSIKKKFLEAS